MVKKAAEPFGSAAFVWRLVLEEKGVTQSESRIDPRLQHPRP
jgi:hypothetical protein